ncbi:hypothetical protein ACJRO7_021286 [Eucalyptus globulus]|uniref:Uncharacterized protein n=1 Tax=Eucalyptus globulus TaxID=34317 RepID=A0ABD3KNU0_EUCGL
MFAREPSECRIIAGPSLGLSQLWTMTYPNPQSQHCDVGVHLKVVRIALEKDWRVPMVTLFAHLEVEGVVGMGVGSEEAIQRRICGDKIDTVRSHRRKSVC